MRPEHGVGRFATMSVLDSGVCPRTAQLSLRNGVRGAAGPKGTAVGGIAAAARGYGANAGQPRAVPTPRSEHHSPCLIRCHGLSGAGPRVPLSPSRPTRADSQRSRPAAPIALRSRPAARHASPPRRRAMRAAAERGGC